MELPRLEIVTSQFTIRPLVRILCLPDVDKAIGGVKQLYRHVEHLCALGWDAAMVTEVEGFRPSWFASSAPTVSLQKAWIRGDLEPKRTILVLPETYLGVDFRTFRGLDLSSLSRVVFNQNAYYSYGEFAEDTPQRLQKFYDDPAVLQVLSVSENTHTFLSRNLGLGDQQLSRIINAIEPMFQPSLPKQKFVHWMPRKNPEHVQAVLQGLQRSRMSHTNGWKCQPLLQLSHGQVAEHLNNAQLFLAFGHPEGFGLPIAEAMASGCWVVGYSGGGGNELFRFGGSEQVVFGDWSEFVAALQRAFTNFALAPRETALILQRQSLAVRSLYSAEQERRSIQAAWERIAMYFQHWRELIDVGLT